MAIKPWLWLPAKFAHDLAPYALELAMHLTAAMGKNERRVMSRIWHRKGHEIFFENPLGIAGGVDKDGRQIGSWRHFGAGFVEIGTVTPKPQVSNPGKIISRIPSEEALWNRMGFPSPGALITRSYLREFRMAEAKNADRFSNEPHRRFPVLVNIGKQRETSLDHAVQDYLNLIDLFSEDSMKIGGQALVDAFVINISSPNTKGLRDIFRPDRLAGFLTPLADRLKKFGRPGLLKLSPDMDDETRRSALAMVSELDLDGVVVTNTTASRPKGLRVPLEGGLSGLPLQGLARDFLLKTVQDFDRDALAAPERQRLIISVGGVLTGVEAKWRLENGADLVETYSGLVFSGPRFFRQSLENLT